jgi:hypothetical protein
VKETLQFILYNAVADTRMLDNSSDELNNLHKEKTQLVMKMLGLLNAANTIAGNALLRGVSGGMYMSNIYQYCLLY